MRVLHLGQGHPEFRQSVNCPTNIEPAAMRLDNAAA
jgi:hypothetical protein